MLWSRRPIRIQFAFQITITLALFFSIEASARTKNLAETDIKKEKLETNAEQRKLVPVSWLRGPAAPKVYRVKAGDILGVYIEGILPERGQIVPLSFPARPPGAGVPIVIDGRGKIKLPSVGRVDVDGMTVGEVEKAIIKAMGKIVNFDEGKTRVLTSLMRERQIEITIVRLDLEANGSSFREKFTLPEVSADVLSALGNSGGLPKQATAEVVILRNRDNGKSIEKHVKRSRIRIPLRRASYTKQPSPQQMKLQSGDIVIVKP